MDLIKLVLEVFAIVGTASFILIAILFPFFRYIFCRIILFFRFLFCKGKFSEVGFCRCLFPHFGSKPDILLLSGKNLYAIKFVSFRKIKKIVTFSSDKAWDVENIIPNPPSDNETPVGKMFGKWHSIRVFAHKRKAPYRLVEYTARINKALANDPIDCVPVYLFSPSIKTLRTITRVDIMNGDTTFYGVVLGNGFYPDNIQKGLLHGADSRRIFKAAKQALRKRLPKERTNLHI